MPPRSSHVGGAGPARDTPRTRPDRRLGVLLLIVVAAAAIVAGHAAFASFTFSTDPSDLDRGAIARLYVASAVLGGAGVVDAVWLRAWLPAGLLLIAAVAIALGGLFGWLVAAPLVLGAIVLSALALRAR